MMEGLGGGFDVTFRVREMEIFTCEVVLCTTLG